MDFSLVRRQLAYVAGSVERLRDLSRPARLERSEVDLHELVDFVLRLYGETARRESIGVIRRFEAANAIVEGHREELQQVLIHLVLNAIDVLRGLENGARRKLTLRVREDRLIRGP